MTAMFGCSKYLCVLHDWMGVWKSVLSSGVWGFWWNWLICHGEPIDWDPRDVFVRGAGGGASTLKVNGPHRPPPPHPAPFTAGIGAWKCWHTEKPRNPWNPPEKKLGGRVRWSLGMHSEESVTYLLAELSEPCLSQPLPPRPVRLTSPPTFPSVLFFNLP